LGRLFFAIERKFKWKTAPDGSKIPSHSGKREMTQKLQTLPKVLVICNRQTTGMLWTLGLREQKINVFFEPMPSRALENCAESSPDLIVIDMNSPKDALLQLVRSLREITFVPTLLLTQTMTEEEVVEAYKAGVDDCIFKPLSVPVFVAKINVWLRHSENARIGLRDSLRVGTFSLTPAARSLMIAGGHAPIKLTNLELNLLHYLLPRAGRSIPADELTQVIWGYAAVGDRTMLENLINRLRQKIEADPSKPRYIKTEADSYKLVVE
jgi:two-component system KDP operon response regulator KdpE